MNVQLIVDFLKNFGFPIAVACWALWRLDKNWAKGDNIQQRLDAIDESLDRIEVQEDKNAEIQNEMLNTIKILNGIISNQRQNIGGK